jgi:hypothetical protein
MNGASVSVPDATLAVRHPEPDGAVLEFAGHWLSQRGLPEPSGALSELRAARGSHLAFEARQITAWDSGLVTLVLKVLGEMAVRGVAADLSDPSDSAHLAGLVQQLRLDPRDARLAYPGLFCSSRSARKRVCSGWGRKAS